MTTTSYLMIGFLVADFLLFRLVNYRDANIRSYSWNMMSSTVSIYLAVVLDSCLKSLVLELAVGRAHLSPSSKDLVRGLCSLLTFVAGFLAVNCFNYRLRASRRNMYALSVIGGHITAFAGIGCVESIVETGLSCPVLSVFAAGVFLVLFGLRAASRTIRRRLFGLVAEKVEEGAGESEPEAPTSPALPKLWLPRALSPTNTAPAAERSAPEEENSLEWRLMTVESEDEACAIIQSFLVKELVFAFAFSDSAAGKPPSDEHSVQDIVKLLSIEVLALALLLLSAYWVKAMDKKISSKGIEYTRIVLNAQGTLAMAMSWLALQLFFWVSMVFFKVEHHFIEVISAVILTCFAILGIIILDWFADRLVPKAEQVKARPVLHRARSTYRRLTDQVKGWLSGTAEEAPGVTAVVAETFADTKNFEKAIRLMINAIALSVGLAWEHAFHAASSTVIDASPALSSHPILSLLAMASLSYALMFPVWMDFLVVMARKTLQQFEDLIEASSSQ